MQYQINGKVIPKFAIGTWAWGAGINGSRMVLEHRQMKMSLRKHLIQPIKKALYCGIQPQFMAWVMQRKFLESLQQIKYNSFR